VRAVKVIVVEEEREAGGAVETGVVRASISPLASEGLDEAFGLAVGLGSVRTGEAMLEAQLAAGLGEKFGAISGAAVGEEALNADAMSLVEVDGVVKSGQDTGSLFIREEGGESQARVVIDGNMEGLDTSAWIAVGTIASGADAGLVKTAKLFNIKMKELARSGAFVTHDRRPGRVEGSQAIEAVAAQDAGQSGFGDGKSQEDLSIGAALTAEGQDLIFEERRNFARLTKRDGGEIIQARREAGGAGASEPFADSFQRRRRRRRKRAESSLERDDAGSI